MIWGNISAGAASSAQISCIIFRYNFLENGMGLVCNAGIQANKGFQVSGAVREKPCQEWLV
jgi:hypothetical protein